MLRLLSLWLFVIVANAGSVHGSCQQHHCVAVIDAGSTGSRLHIYAYDLDKSNTPVKINELWSKKITPGLATIDPTPSVINAYFIDLFANTPEQNMPVYLYATAGMRLFSQAQQQKYYNLIQQWFKTKPQWQLKASQTIPGDKEGLFGWLAVNYQLGTLSSTEKPLVGVMDMGGASVQVVFPIQKTTNVDQSDLIEVNIYGRKLKLFDRSFLGLGQTLVSQQFLDTPSCFANNYKLPSGSSAQGDAASCQLNVSKLINTVHAANNIVQPVLTANPVNSWYVIGGLPMLLEKEPFQFKGNYFTSEQLLQQANSKLCQKKWQDLQSQYPTNEFIYNSCLVSSYYYALMVNGYGLKPKQPINYLPSTKQADWTLGVVLHQQ